MTVRAAHNHTSGVRTFYVGSESQPGVQYVAQHIRRAGRRFWACSCPDFLFRRQMKRSHRSCKHLRQLTAMTREAHGVSFVADRISAEITAA